MGVILEGCEDGCRLFGVASARPARAYPARIAALARAPFALRKGRWRPPALVSCPGVLLPWPPAEVGDEGVLELIG